LPDVVTITINGREVQVKAGTVVTAALLTAAIPCRRSSTGQLRTALCGMGVCFECRATVDGVAHRRTCQLLCRSGMVVETR
jgi:D-hydroxyproline dehydrogenase subunit gamma